MEPGPRVDPNQEAVLPEPDPVLDPLARCLVELGIDIDDELILAEVARSYLELTDPEYPK